MSSNNDENKIDFAKDVLEHNNSLITLIDTKSGLVLGSAGIILGLLSFFDRNNLDTLTLIALFVTMGLLASTILFSFFTIFPRITKKEKNETAIFYQSIIKNTMQEYEKILQDLTPDKILKDYANNIHSLANVQNEKFNTLRISLGFMMASIGSLVITLICYLRPQS